MNQYNNWPVDPNKPLPEFCDTILLNGAGFKALFKGGKNYTWRIGNDNREFKGPILNLLFDDYINDTNNLNTLNRNYYKPVPVRLRVENTPGTCIPASDSVLANTRNLVFAKESPWLGTYKGISDIDGKERTISIYRYMVNSDPFQNYSRTAFVNLPNLLNKDTIVIESQAPPLVLRSFKYFWWDLGEDKVYESGLYPGHHPLDGLCQCKIFIQPVSNGRDCIRIEYRYATLDKQVKSYVFTGVRVP